MEPNLEILNKKIEELSNQTNKLLYYMNSDPSTKRKGLVEKLDIIEEMMNDMIVREKILKAKATVYGSVGSFIFMIIWQIITKYFMVGVK